MLKYMKPCMYMIINSDNDTKILKSSSKIKFIKVCVLYLYSTFGNFVFEGRRD